MGKLAYLPLFEVEPDIACANRVSNDFTGVTTEDFVKVMKYNIN